MQANKEKPGPFEIVCTLEPRLPIHRGGMHVPPGLSVQTVNRVVSAINVQVIALFECEVGAGCALDLDERDAPSLHYIREGHASIYTRNERRAEIGPKTLVIVPPKCPFRFEPSSEIGSTAFMLCGIFRSLYGDSADLFDTLDFPIIEQFFEDDALESSLQFALTELVAGNPCSDVLVSTAVKQVIVALIRRSFRSMNSLARRFAVLSATEQDSAHMRK